MKKIYYFTLILFTISCQKQNETFLLSGKLSNQLNDTIILTKRDFEKKITLTNEKSFKEKINDGFGYYNLKTDNNNFTLYLEPNFNLNISLLDKSSKIKFKGGGKLENDYLIKKDSLRKKLFDLESDMIKLYSTEEGSFISLIDSIELIYNKLLISQQNLSDKFLQLEKKWIKVNSDIKINRYQSIHKSVTNNPSFKVSNSFPKVYKNIELNNFDNVEIQDEIYLNYS